MKLLLEHCSHGKCIVVLQAADCHKHPLLDWAALEWSPAMAGQGLDTDGFSISTLLQYVLNSLGKLQKTAHYKDQYILSELF